VTAAPSRDRQIQQRVLLGTASNYAGQLVNLVTLFFLTPFILHRLGATAYGLWVLIGSLTAYASLLDFGIWGAVIKYAAEFQARGEHSLTRALVATALRLYTGLGLAVALASLLGAAVIPPMLNLPADQRGLAAQLMLMMGFGVGLSLPGMMPLSILRGWQRYDLVSLVEIAATLFTAAASVALLLAGGGVREVVIANLGGLGLMMLMSAWLVQRLAPELRLGWRGADRRLVRQVAGFSWPLFVKDAAGRLQTRTDEITIGAFLPVSVIPAYNLARRLSETTHVLVRQFMKVLLPLASELHAENDAARLRRMFIASTRLTLVLAVAIGGTLSLLARPILSLWVGPAYASASSLVAVLTLASGFATVQWPAGAVLQGMTRHRLLAATSLGLGLLNLAISVALVGPLGLMGVALGTLIPSAIEFAIVVPYTMRVVGVSAATAVKEILWPALSPAAPMGLALYFLRPLADTPGLLPTLAVAAAGLAGFGIAYLALGASRAERQTYRGLAFGALRLAREHLRRSG
jgi:O-antigen/teichoic acid export membrane protein